MNWTIRFNERVERSLRKIDKLNRQRIFDFPNERLATAEHPCNLGQPLTCKRATLWRYRVGDYRIVCEILDDELVVLVIRVGHRKDIYQ